ncbi:hypothetical protein O181_012115 [Austropuccinia psidii MF-1]|uniref:Uncharacterized protein n=1 Tax=Austropuccinia psidii MF-1 TaxID=1389203 RepID=A0A9Q3BWG9_9BASI|nr:hypothetical protein [Austropuccinia psidii MF-1]
MCGGKEYTSSGMGPIQHWKEKPHDLLFLDIMGPFNDNPLDYWYIMTICDHAFTYSFVYLMQSRKDAPEAILEPINPLWV